MCFISKAIEGLRKEYKGNQQNKTIIELIHFTKSIKKGTLNSVRKSNVNR